MPRSLGFGLSNATKAVTESNRATPFLRRLGHFPGLQRPKLCWSRPALGYRPGAGLPRVSSPEDSTLYVGRLRLHFVQKRIGRMPMEAGSPRRRPGLPPGAQLHSRRRARGQGSVYPGKRELRPEATTWGTPGALAVRNQPRGLLPVRPYASPELARGALPICFLLPYLSGCFRHLLQIRDRPSPDPAPQHLTPDTHLLSRLTHPSRLRSLRLGGGRSSSFSGSFGRQYGGPAGRRPDGDKRFITVLNAFLTLTPPSRQEMTG